MTLRYMGVPDRCPHGEYEDRQCDKCEIERLGRCNEQLSRSHAEVRNILERQNIELLAIVAHCRRYAPSIVAAAEKNHATSIDT